MAGYCDRVVVTLLADGGVRVEDNGRGIPTDTAPGQDMPGGDDGAHRCCTPAASSAAAATRSPAACTASASRSSTRCRATLIVEVKNRGYRWPQSFSLGVPDADARAGPTMEDDESTGTTITWWASSDDLRDDDHNFETIAGRHPRDGLPQQGPRDRRTRRAPSTPTRSPTRSADSTIDASVDRRQPTRSSPTTTGGSSGSSSTTAGLVDYVEHLNRPRTRSNPHASSPSRRVPRGIGRHMSLEVAMQWNTSSPSRCTPSPTRSTPTRAAPTRRASAPRSPRLVNNWGEEWGLIKKKEDRLSGDDIREGLTAIISVKLDEPQFEGQTKTKLGNTEAKGFTQKVVNDQLGAWFEKNPAEGKDIVRKSQAAATRAHRRPQGPRPRPQPQGPARRRRPPRQAERLPVDQPRGVRGLHRRG